MLFKINDNKYGRVIGYKSCQKLINQHENSLYIIDIRSKASFKEARVVNSIHIEDSKPLSELLENNKKVLIVHDSDIELTEFYIKSGVKTFNDKIYQLDFIGCNLTQYCCEPVTNKVQLAEG